MLQWSKDEIGSMLLLFLMILNIGIWMNVLIKMLFGG